MSRNSSGKRPGSANSRNAWNDDGLDAPGGRPDSQQSGEFEDRDLRLEGDDGDMMPTAMESEAYVDGEIVVAGQEKKRQKPKPVSGFAKFKQGFRSIWATSSLMDSKAADSETKAYVLLRELVLYSIFLTLLVILTFGMTNSNMYYFTKNMQELFIDSTFADTKNNFRGMTTMQDFWRFTEGPLITGLYTDWETYYNADNVTGDDLGYIYFENKMLGVPRIRQIKVGNGSCDIHPDFEAEIKQCFAAYSSTIEDKNPFGLMEGDAWTYHTADELDGSNVDGMLGTYSGAGYFQNLAANSTRSLELLAQLKENLWIDRGTRVVFIDFSVYNANINLFCIVRLTVEFPATGGVIPSWVFRTVKLLRYVSPMDFFVLGCEGLFFLFLCYYIVEEILEIKKHKLGYFTDLWNWLDILIIIISLICVAFNCYRTYEVDHKLAGLLAEPDVFGDFEFLSYWQNYFNYGIALAVFLAWIKVFKYVSFNKTMTQLTSTLGKAKKDVVGFLVMFFIIFFAFAQLGYLLFGTQVRDFSNLPYALLTLFRIILGDFDFHELESAQRILGPLYFIFFVFFVFFVLLNMFLAIINDTYAEVKAELADAKNEIEMSEFFKQQYNKMMSKMNLKRDKISGIQRALKAADRDNDKKIDINEFRTELKSRGYGDQEIEAAFAKYDVDGDQVLDEEEQRKMQDDLERQRATLAREFSELEHRVPQPKSSSNTYSSGEESDDEDTSGSRSSRRQTSRPINGVAYEEFTVLSRRVDRMEHSIGSIVSKIDAVLVKLEAMEKAKLKRRENMGRLLDSINESDVNTDEMKRDQMERLVREELERWDSESNMDGGGSGSATQRASPSAGSGGRAGVRSANSD
ncbi:polycystin-2-like isoform X2 [Watersipora subatra]|uniref:polycystin-2-like isoform X2 n=1 Tax=Watersipora subatra TaxID=2589382 RepID=UPI00355C62F1